MAGKRGLSGRKRGTGMSAVEHAARGTYRASVHGPLPPGVVPARSRPVLVARGKRVPAVSSVTVPAPPVAAQSAGVLTDADCPDVLTPEGRALWGVLVTQRPTDKMLGAFVAMYVEATLAWKRATAEVQKRPDFGMIGKKPVPNPHLKLRREAEATMFRVAQLLGWQAPVTAAGALVGVEPQRSRLDLFLSSRGSA